MREEVDLPTIDALQREWRRNPPVHHLVAAYLAYKPPLQVPAGRVTEDPDIEGLLGYTGPIPVKTLEPIDTTAFDQAMAANAASDGSSAHG